MRTPMALLFALAALVAACGSSSSPASTADSGADAASSGACPNVAGNWKVTQHCDASLVGQSAPVTQNGCSLSFGGLFVAFTGTVTPDGKVSVSGPNSCTGTVSASTIAMTCTPGTCTVTLTKTQ